MNKNFDPFHIIMLPTVLSSFRSLIHPQRCSKNPALLATPGFGLLVLPNRVRTQAMD